MTRFIRLSMVLAGIALVGAGCFSSKTTTETTNTNTSTESVNTNNDANANATGTFSTNSSDTNTGTGVNVNASIGANVNAVVTPTASVSVKGMAFSPSSLTVKKGTKVTWKNNDSIAHTVTGDNGGPNSNTLSAGDSYSFTFNTVGSFPYHCNFHPSLTGTVKVTE